MSNDTATIAEYPSASPSGDPWLLTPGPLTTSVEVKQVMLHDYGSRDQHLIAINQEMRDLLVKIIDGEDDFTTVPLQGSGTFVVEAMLGTFIPPAGKLLILINGAYGTRMVKICDYLGRAVETIETAENVPVDPAEVDRVLAADSTITHVIIVHCETTTGILNPIAEVGEVVARHNRSYLIDAMSAFGAIPLSCRDIKFDAVVASSNKCLEGTPGMGFCLARKTVLENTKGNAHSLSLDLYEQWVAMEKNAQWRFTPPVQVIAGFHQALKEFEAEGGVAGRGGRYQDNCNILVKGMKELGFETLLSNNLQAPIIVTFLTPSDPRFDFQNFYDRLRTQGYIIYPGKLTVADTFRIGCIGKLGADQMYGVLKVIQTTLKEMGISNCAASA